MKQKHCIINLERIDSKLAFLKYIEDLISKSYEKIFHAVIVSGSVATEEIIAYSDFDGLLVVKDEYFNSPLLERFLKDSMNLILEFDPLQHHGWFIIRQSELSSYPQTYLPYEILHYSKLLFPFVNNFTIEINISKGLHDYQSKLNSLMLNLEAQSRSDFRKMRIYDLKSFLSKIMLIPSMYYSVKHDKGVYKKKSFDLVKADFTTAEWKCIQTATDIRINWKYHLSIFQKIIMTKQNRIVRKLAKLFVAPKISRGDLDRLDDEFFDSLKKLIKKLRRNEDY